VNSAAVRGPARLVFFLCAKVSFVGVLKVLSGAFVSSRVIFFAMVLGSGAVRMGSKVPVLSGYLL
jgi:hypothetical protein